MRILFTAEENLGGGAISNYNLAIASTSFAEVAFFGIGYNFIENRAIKYYDSRSKKALRLRYFFNYWKAIINFDPDIVHSTGMYTGMIAIILRIVSNRKYKIVMTLRHSYKKFRLNFIAVKLIKYLNKVDLVHFLTDYQKKLYFGFGLNSQNFKILPNIIIPKNYPVTGVTTLRKKLLNDTTSEWLIAFVGRLVESKQVDIFIRTIKIINHFGHNVGGVIVGDGDSVYKNKLRDLAQEIDITSKLSFAGFTREPELYIKVCDFCMFPTLGEALPRFIIESFSQEKTMVLSNHPSIRNLMSDNIDSMVVSRHDAEQYAEKCIQLIKSPELLKRLERGAYITYNQHYKLDFVINEYKTMYCDIMQRNILN
jgi:glycosyltransferase involved in cell wall biosynthesis